MGFSVILVEFSFYDRKKQQIMSHWLSWELKYPLFTMSLG